MLNQLSQCSRRIRVTCHDIGLLVSTLVLAFVGAVANAEPVPGFDQPGRVIVKFRQNALQVREYAMPASPGAARLIAERRAKSLGERVGVSLRPGRLLDARTQVVLATGLDSERLAGTLSRAHDVEYAVVDYPRFLTAMPNDPLLIKGDPISGETGGPEVGQWYLRAPAGDALSAINAVAAWEFVQGDPAIIVAVLDSGVRYEHPDLKGRLLPGFDMIADADIGADGNGREGDASDPGDWISREESESPSGRYQGCNVSHSSWHGTKTASLIGANLNDGIGMAGVASGVRLLPVRVIGKCGGFDSDIIAGIRWAAGLSVPDVPPNPYPARVINLSLGGAGACTFPFLEAITLVSNLEKPVVVVASAGNSAGRAVGAPANCRGVVAVGALRHAGTKVGYSDVGAEIAISAPGGNCVSVDAGAPCQYAIIAATDTGKTVPRMSAYADAFNSNIGTSNSAPLVAGTVALMLSANPGLTPAEVRSILRSTARPFPQPAPDDAVRECRMPDGRDQLECVCVSTTCGAGMLDTAAAVEHVRKLQWNCLFDWVERGFSQWFPAGAVTRFDAPYNYRYYPKTDRYLGVSRETQRLYHYAGASLDDLGPAAGWLAFSRCGG